MRERPILFSDAMVRAILAGTKTQTRRLVKPQPEFAQVHMHAGRVVRDAEHRAWCWRGHDFGDGDAVNARPGSEMEAMCPYGVPGDRLWVREACALVKSPGLGDWRWPTDDEEADAVWFRATDSLHLCHGPREIGSALDTYAMVRPTRWRPSIHMPRWACRIVLDVVDMRVERLHDISDDDARAEGLAVITKDGGRTWKFGVADRDGLPGTDNTGWPWSEWDVSARKAYARLWDSINGARAPWSANPWVWAVTFKPVEASR
jgi:hypothetical protein